MKNEKTVNVTAINLVDPGWLERTVRFLIGLPMATAYFYARHLSMNWAYAWLGIGLAIMLTGLVGHDPQIVHNQAPQTMGREAFRWTRPLNSY